MREITVKVIRKAGRKYLILRWTDPKSGKLREKSSGRTKRRDAEREASKLEAQMAEGLYRERHWYDEIKKRYVAEHLGGMAPKSQSSFATAARHLERIIDPQEIAEVADPDALSRFQSELRKSKTIQSAVTVNSYLTQIRAFLGWCEAMQLISRVPKMVRLARAKGPSQRARSRPIVGEELDRLLVAARSRRPHDAEQWVRFLRGLHEAGLRIGEFIGLSWTPGPDHVWINTSYRIPLIQIPHGAEKAHRDRFQPITPEFWEVCCETPADERRGLVYPIRGRGGQFGYDRIVHVIGEIGREARIVTDPTTGKCATSQDIGRRRLATKLGGILSQGELSKWMRHESADTTMSFYHLPDALALADRVWSPGGVLGGIAQKEQT